MMKVSSFNHFVQKLRLETFQEKRIVTFACHVKEVFSHSVYVYLLLGYISYTMLISSVAYWGAKGAYIMYEIKDIVAGSTAAVCGLAGTLIGGWLLDRIGSTISKALGYCTICCILPGSIFGLGFLGNPPFLVFLVMASLTVTIVFSLQVIHRLNGARNEGLV